MISNTSGNARLAHTLSTCNDRKLSSKWWKSDEYQKRAMGNPMLFKPSDFIGSKLNDKRGE